MNLEEMLKRVEDRNIEKQKEKKKRVKNGELQDQMDIFRRELEQELRLDLEREVSRIRQVEVSKVKVEESQKHR